MTQYARPASDISVGLWTDEGSSFNDGNLYTSIREVTQDGDTSYVNSTNTVGDTFEVKLETITDPEVGTGHIAHVYAKATGGASPEKIDIWLVEGTTIIEQIASNWAPGRGSYADLNFTLILADDIADYTDLRIRVTIAVLNGAEQIDVTQIYLETPDASGSDDLTAVGITADPVVGIPSADQIINLTAVNIITTPALGTPEIPGNLAEFFDNFDDDSRDTAKWDLGTDDSGNENPNVTVSETNGRLEITPEPSTYGYYGYRSVKLWDLTKGPIMAKLINAAETNAENTMFLLANDPMDSNNRLKMETESPNLYINYKGLGSTIGISIIYNPTTHLWWRYLADATNVYWQTAPDGYTWTTRYQVTRASIVSEGIDITSLRVCLIGGQWGTNPSPETAIYDFINVSEIAAIGITANPVLGIPTLTSSSTDDLTANSITANPVLGTPSIGQTHVLDSVDITANPVLDTPALAQVHALIAVDITANLVLDVSNIGQTHALDSVDITANPVLGTPVLGAEGEDNLEAVGITADPVVGTPTIGQTHALLSVGISTTPTTGTPTLSIVYILDATGITVTPALDTSTIGQIHVLDSVDITANPVLGTPVLGAQGEDNLEASGITANPVLDTPSIGQIHDLYSVYITANPVVEESAIGQTHALSSTEIYTTPVTGTPILSHIHGLDATSIIVTPTVETPSIGQIHPLDATTILVSPILSVPTAGQTHALDATGIMITPELGIPSFKLIEGIVFIVFSAYQPEIDFSAYQPEIDFNAYQPEISFINSMED